MIKGKATSGIYHLPGCRNYRETKVGTKTAISGSARQKP